MHIEQETSQQSERSFTYTAPQKYSATPIFLGFNIVTGVFIFRLFCNNK